MSPQTARGGSDGGLPLLLILDRVRLETSGDLVSPLLDGKAMELKATTSSAVYKAYCFCIFAGPAITSTYLNLFFHRRGLSDAQIGALSGVLAVVGIVSPPLWGAIADAIGSNMKPGLFLMVTTALLFPVFACVKSYPLLLLLMSVFGFCFSPITPLGDAAIISYSQRRGRTYASIRLWGSLGFVVVITSCGLLLPGTSGAHTGSLLPIFGAFVVWRVVGVLVGVRIKEGRPETVRERSSIAPALREVAALFRRPRMALFAVCAGLGWGAMQAYYAFFTIYLDTLHVPDSAKGLFWNIGVLAEILFLTFSGPFVRRAGPYPLFTLGLAAQAARLCLFSFPAPLWVIGVGQLLHAFTFASFYLGCIAFLSENVPDRLRAGGQTWFAGLVMGLGAAAGAWIAGNVAHTCGLAIMFRAGSATASIGCCLSLVLFARPRKTGSLCPIAPTS